MNGPAQTSHRAGLLKQQNKSHKNGRHRTKSEIDKTNKGRVHVKVASRKNKNKDLKRDERRKKANQIRQKKREEVLARKREIGGDDNAPIVVAIIPLGQSANIEQLMAHVKSCDENAKISTTGCGVFNLMLPRFRQHFSVIIPKPGDLYAALDACKAANCVVFLMSPPSDTSSLAGPKSSDNDGYLGIDQPGEELLAAVMAQGLPTPLFVLNDIENVPLKRRGDYKKALNKHLERIIPIEKLHVIEKENDTLRLLHQIGSQKQRPVYQRDMRSNLLAEETKFVQNDADPTVGCLIVDGFIRYQPLNVNGLVHIPGWGDFQLEKIEVQRNPGEFFLLEEADPSLQETLKTENDPDPLNGEQTWPYQEEMEDHSGELVKEDTEANDSDKKKSLRKGASEFQAAWIKDDDSIDEESDEDDNSTSSEGCEDMVDDASDGEENPINDDEDEMESVGVPESEIDDRHYDKKVSFADEEEDLKRIKDAREDELFPDEVDTPREMLAKVRFQKYRGLHSFRTSPWDPKENLPLDYSRTFQFENFQRTKKRILKEERIGAKPGWYVRVYVKNVPSHLAVSLPTNYPFSLIGLLPHEQKMSVVNVVLKRTNSSRDQQPVPSKERLIFHVGYRRYAVEPIFSQHTAANKHKFERFFRPESVVVATFYAPIIFPSASVLVFREKKDGSQIMIATGSVMSVNPDRIAVKRAVLSGPPFKVHRKPAVVRFMFFNREDIEWFKPVELRTKYGRRGHIREPLGTHGHMKCVFDGPIKSQDTIMMNLYKRVFPKWTYDSNVSAPPSLYGDEVEMEDASKMLMS